MFRHILNLCLLLGIIFISYISVNTIRAEPSQQRWAVQLGAFSTKQTAEGVWNKLIAKHHDVLSSFAPTYIQTEKNKKILYRLRVGNFHEKKLAQSLCQSLKEKGEKCYSVISKASIAESAQKNAISSKTPDKKEFKPHTATPIQEDEIASDNKRQKKWGPHVNIELRDGNKRDIARGELFLPIKQSNDDLIYADIRGLQDNLHNYEGNIGLGYRRIIPNSLFGKDWIFGGYGFIDARYSEARNRFFQTTLGLEALSDSVDLRSNVYIPQKGTKAVRGTADVEGTVVGTQLRLVGTSNVRERALPGLDVELGYKLPIFTDQIDTIKLYGGGYYFNADDYDRVAGPRGRLELQWQNFLNISDDTRFTVGVEVQKDEVRDTSAFGIARLRLPLYNTKDYSKRDKLSAIEQRMTSRVVRDVDIVSVKQRIGRKVDELATISVNGVQTSSVTIVDATDDVPVELAAAGAGSTVIIDGSEGLIEPTAVLTLMPNQSITGGGVPIRGTATGLVGTIGSRPTISDINIPIGQRTIEGNSAGNDFTIENIDVVSNNSGDSLHFSAADNVTLRNVTSTGGVSGVSMGIFAVSTVNNALLDNVTISNTSGIGVLQLGGTTTIQNSQIRDTVSFGMLPFGGTTNLTNVEINNPGLSGVFGISGTMNINNVQVVDAGTDSFEFNGATLSGAGNTSINPTVLDCDNGGGTTGSITVNGLACP